MDRHFNISLCWLLGAMSLTLAMRPLPLDPSKDACPCTDELEVSYTN
jgi:hypothetical protein